LFRVKDLLHDVTKQRAQKTKKTFMEFSTRLDPLHACTPSGHVTGAPINKKGMDSRQNTDIKRFAIPRNQDTVSFPYCPYQRLAYLPCWNDVSSYRKRVRLHTKIAYGSSSER